jgi:hypothetical protein
MAKITVTATTTTKIFCFQGGCFLHALSITLLHPSIITEQQQQQRETTTKVIKASS